jgi:hypothetical protein
VSKHNLQKWATKFGKSFSSKFNNLRQPSRFFEAWFPTFSSPTWAA